MTTKELLDEYVNLEILYKKEKFSMDATKQATERAKELEASIRKEIYKELSSSLPASQLVADIRKEVVEEIWKVIKDTDGSVGLRSVEIIKEVKEYALLKGITLQ